MELITDRTQADVDRAKELAAKGWVGMSADEQAEWLAGLKGTYNHTDLNRVESAVAELAEELCLPLKTKTDWTNWDKPKQSAMERYVRNVKVLRDNAPCFADTPKAPNSAVKLTYTKANDIEKILTDVNKTIPIMFRSDELFCDEV